MGFDQIKCSFNSTTEAGNGSEAMRQILLSQLMAARGLAEFRLAAKRSRTSFIARETKHAAKSFMSHSI